MRFSIEGCEDSHIKIPKDIIEYLEKEMIFFLGRLKGERKFFIFEEDLKEKPTEAS